MERGTVRSEAVLLDYWERMNEIWSEAKGTVGPKVEVVDSWERLNEIWSEGKGNVGSKVEVVDSWDRMNEIWSGGKGAKVEVVDSWERLSEIWPEGKGTAGEKLVLVDDSPCAATNISDAVDVSGSHEEDRSWISGFCNIPGNKFFCRVDIHYILDDFNLCGLSDQVPYYDHALDLILDEESSSSSSSHGEIITEEQNELIESAAEMLYGMIHARYILTYPGFQIMLNKFNKYDFGRCPRVYCRGQHCLPIGLSDIPRASTMKIYCPQCEDVYDPPSKCNIDGAYFGTTFPHLFLMTYESRRPEKVSQSYVPRVFGFKLHKP